MRKFISNIKGASFILVVISFVIFFAIFAPMWYVFNEVITTVDPIMENYAVANAVNDTIYEGTRAFQMNIWYYAPILAIVAMVISAYVYLHRRGEPF
jgi:hypothetical protein